MLVWDSLNNIQVLIGRDERYVHKSSTEIIHNKVYTHTHTQCFIPRHSFPCSHLWFQPVHLPVQPLSVEEGTVSFFACLQSNLSEWREAKEEQTCSIRAQVERKWQMFRCEGFQSKIMEKLENYTGTNSLCVFERGEQKRKINIVVRLNYIICLILTQFHWVPFRHYSVAVLMKHILTRSHRILSKHKQDHNIPSIELR